MKIIKQKHRNHLIEKQYVPTTSPASFFQSPLGKNIRIFMIPREDWHHFQTADGYYRPITPYCYIGHTNYQLLHT